MSDINIDILDGGLGLAAASGDDVHAVIGVCSLGNDFSIVATRDPSNLIAARGKGPSVQAACFALNQGAGTVLHVKAPIATPGKVENSDATPVAITSSTNATPPVVTTTAPHGLVSGEVVTIAGHLVNTAINGTFRVSVLSSTTFSIPGVVGVGAGAATGTVQRTGIVAVTTSTGTSTPVVTGTPVDCARVRWKWIKGGTRGTSGATFAYSIDGGATYSAELQMGTATSYTINELGVVVTWGVGTWIAADEYRFVCIDPKWNDSGIVSCIRALGTAGSKFRLINLIGELASSSAITFAAEMDTLRKSYRYAGLLGHARDFRAADVDEPGWIAALQADYQNFADPRISVTAGHYQVVDTAGNKMRRPLSFVAAARLMARPIQEHAGKVKVGALKGIAKPTDADAVKLGLDALIYHDERTSAGLTSSRFFCAKTRIGRPGWYIDQPNMMATPGSDFSIWPRRSVMDKACDTTYEVLVDEVNDDLDIDLVTGHITEKEARGLESKLSSQYTTDLVATRNASGVSATISREDNILSTSTVTAHVRVTPRGYLGQINIDVGYTNPDLNIGG